MDREQVDALVAHYLDAQLLEVEKRLASDAWRVNGTAPQGEDWNATARGLLAEEAQELEQALAYNDLRSRLDSARTMLPNASPEGHRLLARRLLEARFEVACAESKALQGEPLRRFVSAPKGHSSAPAVAPKASPMLSLVLDEFKNSKEGKGKWRPKTIRAVDYVTRVMLDLLGDRPVSTVTKEDMRKADARLPRIPSNVTKRYPKLSLREAIERADKEGNSDRVSPKTQNDYRMWFRSFWKWAATHDFVATSPAIVLEDAEEGNARDRRDDFTGTELRTYFGFLRTERDTNSAHWWAPVLMLYAGLRTEEAAKLRPADIREVDGVLCVDVNEAAGRNKTRNANRLVPVHRDVIALGLSEFVRKVVAERGADANLFALRAKKDGKFSVELSKTLNRRLAQAGIKRKELVAYGLRHTFDNRLKNADVAPHVLNELMGHENAEL